MSKLLIKNGLIFDPINNIDGEIKDLQIEDGIFVDRFSNEKDIQEIDAKDNTVIPGALDIHAHVASQQTNWVRLLGSKNSNFNEYWQGLTLKKIARDYISNGYTFIIEANTYPSLAKQTIFNFRELPVLDKGMLLNISNIWPLELEFKSGKIEDMSVFISDLLNMTKSYGLKVYNPFEAETWNFKKLRDDINKSGRLYYFSALDVYENLTKANELLGLPHSIHAHIEGYETEQGKENLFCILEKIKSLNINSKAERSQVFHLAHASAYNIDGNNSELLKILNNSNKIDLDLGFLCFNVINPLITSDRRQIEAIQVENETKGIFKLIRSAIETEGDSFSSLRVFDKKNELHNILWANALDLALNIKNKWQVQITLNYPIYGDINNIPEIASWLLSEKAREEYKKELWQGLPQTKGSLTFNELIIMSRSSPARSLGLKNIKGNLGNGADGDLNILDINLNDVDTNNDYDLIKKSLKNIKYVIKAGEIIKNHDKVKLDSHGKIFWADGQAVKEDKSIIMNKKKEFYEKYYSIFYDSLKVSIDNKYLRKIDSK